MYYVCLYEVRCTIFAKNVKYLQKEFLSSQPLVNIRGKRVNKEVVFANIDVDRLALMRAVGGVSLKIICYCFIKNQPMLGNHLLCDKCYKNSDRVVLPLQKI